MLPERCIVPFLPIHPQLSSTRNQGRQKLARFTPKEFATLIIDILTEAGHRHTLANNTPLQGNLEFKYSLKILFIIHIIYLCKDINFALV